MHFYSLEELATIEESDAVEALTQDVTYILTGLSEVSVERANKYFQALADKYKELDDMTEAVQECDEDEELRAINNDLYGEVYDRLEIPKDNPNETLIERLSEAWDDGLEQVVISNWT